MSEVVFERDAKVFLDKYGDWLRQKEVEHSLMLAVCNGAITGKYPKIHCFAVLKEGLPSLLAVCTPPYHLLLSESSGECIDKLACELAKTDIEFPGVLGPSSIAKSFVNRWVELTNKKFTENMRDFIYVLHKVNFPQPKGEGEFYFAQDDDLDLFTDWNKAFVAEALPDEKELNEDKARERVERLISSQNLAVWRVGGKPVSCASLTVYDGVARVGFVYTPPKLRGKGYASAVAAHLSQHALDKGARYCCLYANAANGTSNSIYKKMGYELVTEAVLYLQEKQG